MTIMTNAPADLFQKNELAVLSDTWAVTFDLDDLNEVDMLNEAIAIIGRRDV